MMNRTHTPQELSDRELIARVHELARRERRAVAELVAHLAELDARRLYLGEGCPSLFVYCTDVLHFSEHAAYNRIAAARASRRFPVILDRLADGSIHLTAVTLLAPHLTEDNHESLLDEASHASKRDVQKIVARLEPREVASVIRKLPSRVVVTDGPNARDLFEPLLDPGDGDPVSKVPESTAKDGITGSSPRRPTVGSTAAVRRSITVGSGQPLPGPMGRHPTTQPAARVDPIAPERYRVQFTAKRSDARAHPRGTGSAASPDSFGRSGRDPGPRFEGAPA